MLFIESTKPLVLKFPNRKIWLEPGIPIPFEETAALKALAQAGHKIHVVPAPALPMVPPEFREGWFISWRSGKKVLGPNRVLGVDAKAGPLWCLVEVKNTPHWISQTIIVSFIPKIIRGGSVMPTKQELQEQLDDSENRLARVREILEEDDADEEEEDDELLDEEEEE